MRWCYLLFRTPPPKDTFQKKKDNLYATSSFPCWFRIFEFAIEYFRELKKKYGEGRERKTEIKAFDTIVATQVAAINQKLYVNREEGFAGYGIKKDVPD